MAGYGIGDDFFGFADADLKLISSRTVPKPVSLEYAMDEDGNKVASGSHDAGPADAIECEYELQNGTLNINTITLGHLQVDAIENCLVTVEVDTSNGKWPSIKMAGFAAVLDFATYPAFTLPSITISGLRKAQLLDFTIGADCKLNASSFKAEGEFHHSLDEAGAAGPMNFTGGVMTIGFEAVEIGAAVSWTPGGTWTETQGPGIDSGNIKHADGTGEAEQYISEDT